MSELHNRLRLMTINPWQRLAEDWPGVPVIYTDLGSPFLHGETRWKDRHPVAIVLHERLNQVQRRCTLAHEIEHLDRGAPCNTLRGTVEARVVRATAKYLLPDIERIASMLAVYDLHRAADELWVTFPVLVDRLRALTDAELEFVAKRCDYVA